LPDLAILEESKVLLSRPPKVITDADFLESRGRLVPCPVEPGCCLVIVAHTNLYGTNDTEDEFDTFEARDFLKMVLLVAEEFQEIQVGLLNHRDAQAAIRRLSMNYSGPISAQVLISLNETEWRHITCGDGETPQSIRLWLRGVLLANGFRSTTSRDDLNVRLAYELAQPATYDFGAARWDVPHFRSKLYNEAKEKIDGLVKKWTRLEP
jgi:hypothetical protein